MGFWERLEAWLQEAMKDQARVARWFLIAYWISMVVVFLGAAIAFAVLVGWWSP